MNAEPLPLSPAVLEPDPADRREHPRRAASALPWLGQARIKYGPEITIVDLSNGGAQIETTAHALQPGMTLVLELKQEERMLSVAAQVIRCQLASLMPQAIYRGAVKFKRPLQLPIAADPNAGARPGPEPVALAHTQSRPAVMDDSPTGDEAAPRGELLEFRRTVEVAPVAELDLDLDAIVDDPIDHPADEYEKLREALRRRTGDPGPMSMASGFTLGTARARALDTISSVARSARAAFPETVLGDEVAQLLRLVTQCVDGGLTSDQATAEMVARLSQVVPGVVVRLISVEEPMTFGMAEALFFDIPAEPNRASVGRLLVEFPGACELQDWHMRLLQVAAQLIGVSKSLDQVGDDAFSVVTKEGSEFNPRDWNRVVVRYLDGSLLKGFSHDFQPERGAIHLWSELDSHDEPKVSVPLSRLKAVFFVRDFEGRGQLSDGSRRPAPAAGRRVSLSFADGEAVIGTTSSSENDPVGLYVSPLDAGSNNVTLFVPRGAVVHVEFA